VKLAGVEFTNGGESGVKLLEANLDVFSHPTISLQCLAETMGAERRGKGV
jgi:hypothetical protein